MPVPFFMFLRLYKCKGIKKGFFCEKKFLLNVPNKSEGGKME